MNDKLLMLIPLFLYLALMLFIAYNTSKQKNTKGINFLEEYFIGSRNMGGFVLAMTLVATYASASSFIGGPGVAYKLGLAWVLLSVIQIPTAFLTLGILGKRLAIISRRINAVTITDYLRARYKSNVVVVLSSIAILIFFGASMVAQFIGGARVIEAITGLDYSLSLSIFAIVVVIYTSFGGFRAVAITDTIQGIVMIIATLFLIFALNKAGGGMANITRNIYEINPDLLTPTSGGNVAKSFMLGFWVLVGVGVLGLPQTSIRAMGFKDSKSMHNAMFIGTLVVGFLMIGMHLIGFMGIGVYPGVEVGDKIIPILSLKVLSPIAAGIFIGGPLAATMSTVDSMLIMSSSAIIKDLYINYINKNAGEKKIKRITLANTFIMGILTYIFALNPPSLLVFINLFAFAGLQAAFLWPILLGLYTKWANKTGAIFSMFGGVFIYIFFSIKKVSIIGLHNIVPSLLISLAMFLIGSYIGRNKKVEVDENLFI